MSPPKSKSKPAAEPTPDLHELADEVSELAGDLAYGLLEVEQAGVTLPHYLAGRVEGALRAAIAELSHLIDEVDALVPRSQAAGRPPTTPFAGAPGGPPANPLA